MGFLKKFVRQMSDAFAPPPEARDAPVVYKDLLAIDLPLAVRDPDQLDTIRNMTLQWARGALPDEVSKDVEHRWGAQSHSTPTASFEAMSGRDPDGHFVWAFRVAHPQRNLPDRTWVVDGALIRNDQETATFTLRMGTREPEHALHVPAHKRPSILRRLENECSVIVDGEHREPVLHFLDNPGARVEALIDYILSDDRTRPVILVPSLSKEEAQKYAPLGPTARDVGTLAQIYICRSHVLDHIYGQIGRSYETADDEMRILRPGFTRQDSVEQNPAIARPAGGFSPQEHLIREVWAMLLRRPDLEAAIPRYETAQKRIMPANAPR